MKKKSSKLLLLMLVSAVITIAVVACGSGGGSEIPSEPFKPSKKGVYFFALSSYSPEQCDKAISIFDGVPNPRVGILYGTFGYDTGCLERMIESFGDRPHTVKVFLQNETCRRFGRFCEPEREVLAGFDVDTLNRLIRRRDNIAKSEILFRAKQAGDVMRGLARAHTELVWATSLEHNFDDVAAEIHTEFVREAIGGALTINPVSPFAQYRGAPGDTFELHGLDWDFDGAAKCSWSNDGIDIDFGSGGGLPPFLPWAEIRTAADGHIGRGCDVWIWWNNQGLQSRFVAPSQRSFEVSSDAISTIREYLRGL